MRLHRLDVTAFGPFGGSQHVDFDDLSASGLFLLHGPTGAGKTSVLDAVCYALYGTVPGARQAGTTLRSDHADPETLTEVVLDVTIGERRLEITRRPEQPRRKKRGPGFTRERAYSALREHRDGAWTALSRSHQEIGEEITGLLGMSREQFCQVVLLPQGDFARFLRSDAEARGRLLGRLFDTGRFSAVEDRLAELRRSAEKRVGDGDDRLLALAHRMAQAAGRGGTPDLPRLAPGEPGLAATVLEWAALARTDAREARDIAAHTLLTAEGAHRAAHREADAERELARLQRRHADARRRAADLEAAEERRERVRHRMERGRAAQQVLPGLELRAAAEREHHTATAAVRGCRERLPDRLAEAGADRLAALERGLREELGRLTAARRAEQRAAAVAAERAALEREAHADEETLHECAAWIAGWGAVRGDHRQRVERAQEAAALAEQLGAGIEPVQQRLDAAHRRDTLTGRAREAEEDGLRSRARAADAHEHWLDLRERRLQGMAAELADGLRADEPCAVCGATEHPRPARTAPDQVDRSAEERALAAFRRAESERDDAEARHRSVKEALAAAVEGAGGASTSELRESAEASRRSYAAARDAAADLHPARQAADAAEREYERRREQQREAERRAAARTSRREVLAAEQESLEAESARARGGAATVAERAGQLEHQAAALGRATRAVQRAEESERRLKEADAHLADAAYRAGFDTPQAAADAVVADGEWRELQHRLDRWQAETVAVAAELADPQTVAAAARPAADLDASSLAVEAATHRLRQASATDAAARERCAELDRLSTRAVTDVRRLAPLREEYERVARLAGLAAGTSAENERKMRLESYVLAARLEQVAAAASARLHRMSSGRYTLAHSDARESGRGRSGLGLRVVDAWTGNERDTATLSGGETFFASLALALGLADVVTQEAGGTRLDTLFIDEGFGSLDEQALDEVLDVLDSLRERNRSVGIVSHVADLRVRIPAQLEVAKGRDGSAIHRSAAGARG